MNVNNLLSINQSGFRPGDSTIYQLLSITSSIYDAFENYDETRAIFLDISKAFDKVWHEGIIFKLKCNGISGNVLKFFENYLTNRYQRLILNGKLERVKLEEFESWCPTRNLAQWYACCKGAFHKNILGYI